jgi:hypothetical protein
MLENSQEESETSGLQANALGDPQSNSVGMKRDERKPFAVIKTVQSGGKANVQTKPMLWKTPKHPTKEFKMFKKVVVNSIMATDRVRMP